MNWPGSVSDKMKSYYDGRSSQQCLEAGDAAWLHVPQRKKGISPKLSRPWQGPYVITKCINDLIYCGSTRGRILQLGSRQLTLALIRAKP